MQLAELRPHFLSALEHWHTQHGYTREIPTLAHALGATLEHSTSLSCLMDWEPPVIVVQSLEGDRFIRPRFLFKAFHELSHLLFLRLEGGRFARSLAQRYPVNRVAYDNVLEGLCNAGAARLLMPELLLRPALELYRYTPKAVLSLSRASGASHTAALRRVMDACPLEIWGSLLQITRRVVGVQEVLRGQWVYSRYQGPGSRYLDAHGLPLPESHPLLQGDLLETRLELLGGPWEDLRPCSSARIGNQEFARVCVFVFPDAATRQSALRGRDVLSAS